MLMSMSQAYVAGIESQADQDNIKPHQTGSLLIRTIILPLAVPIIGTYLNGHPL